MIHQQTPEFHTVGLGTFAPPSYPQRELMEQFEYSNNAFAMDICRNGKIEARSFCEAPAPFIKERDTSSRFRYFRKYAPEMGVQALSRACRGQVDPCDLDALIVVNSTGFILPGLSEILGEQYGIGGRRALRFNLSGQGCYAAVPAIRLARALILSGQAETVAVVCTEPSSCLFSGSTEDRSEVVANLLFGEGAAALVFSKAPARVPSGMPSFLDAELELAQGTLDYVTVELADCWKSKVGPRVPEGGAAALPGVVRRLLERHQLTREEIRHWVFHTGGRRVLDGCQRVLELRDADMAVNFDVLRRYGNMQSGTVLFSLEETLRARPPQSGDHGVLIGIGPGMTVAAMLLQWS